MWKYLILLVVSMFLYGCGSEQSTTRDASISNITISQEEQLPKEIEDFQSGYNQAVMRIENRSLQNMERSGK